jgi:hypothetical protein
MCLGPALNTYKTLVTVGWKTQHCPSRHPMVPESSATSSHTFLGIAVPLQGQVPSQRGQMIGRANTGAALATNIAVMSTTTVTNIIKRFI